MRFLSLPATALLLLALAGCDTFGSDGDAFVGTWEGRAVEETRVVSTVDQRYAGTEPRVRGIGSIEASGSIETSFRYFNMLSEGLVQVEDGQGFALFLQTGGGSHLGNNPSDPAERRFYEIPEAAFTVDLASARLTVPRTVVQTDDGPLTIEGTLTGRPLNLQAGVETELPRFDSFLGQGTLVVSEDGTYTRTIYLSTRSEGTWEVDGDELILTPTDGEPFSQTLVGDELINYGQTDVSVDLQQTELARRLQSGSIESATTSYLTLYQRQD